MRIGAHGLRDVRTEDLTALLRAVHRGELPCPITQIGLGRVGLLRLVDDLGHLRELDTRATTAVLVAVLAERGPNGR
ncbi:MAG: hypothetical protein RLZZ383_594 [Pseudomonadota bacterium]|jgi:hypothetical protein